MDGLNYLIANGPPRIDFSPLSGLLDTYTAAKKARRDNDLIEAFKSGVPTTQDGSLDFSQMSQKLYGLGDLQHATSLAQLGQKQRETEKGDQAYKSLSQYLLSQSGGAEVAPTASPVMARASAAIGGIESGNRYDALGPVTGSGDRAYGKYQVMGANVGPWTKEVLGQELTPQQFAANPQAQEKVFATKFGQYVNKYGPEGASRAWFAGEGGMNNPNASDVNGTTVASYSKKFTNSFGAEPSNTKSFDPVAVGALLSNPRLPEAYQKIGAMLLKQGLEPKYAQTTDESGNVWNIAPNGQRTVALKASEKNGDGKVVPVGGAIVKDGKEVYRNPGSDSNLSDSALDMMAGQYLAGDRTVLQNLGRGAQGSANLVKLRERIAQRASEAGIDPQGILNAMNDQVAKQSGARVAGNREANLEIILRATEAAIPTAIEASRAVARTGFVPLNKIIQAGRIIASDPNQVKFGMANLQLAEHWARAMNPTGVMRESDREKALEFLNTAWSQGTYEQAVEQLRTQIEREKTAVRGGGGHSAPAQKGVDPAAIAEARRRGLIQ